MNSNEFEKDGVKVSAELQSVWAVELDLLEKFKEVMKKHNIRYVASGGTLLGAIRHKGFIPWDDDIDVMVWRDDYEKLIKVASEEFKEPYFFQNAYTDCEYYRGHAQLRRSDTTGILPYEAEKVPFNQGIFIDIFPFDAIPSDEKLAKKQNKKLNSLNRILNSGVRERNEERKGIKENIKKIIAKIINLFYPYKKIFEKMEETCKKYNHAEFDRVGLLSFDPNNPKMTWKKEWFYECEEKDFENTKISVPKEWDKVLREQYGDYNIMVKAPNYHGETIFDTEIGYKEYLEKHKKSVQ